MKKFKPRSIRLDRRHWYLGISSALKWLKKPVSEEGATQVARFMLGINGPDFLREVEQMRNHPVGRRLLEDKPELQAAISADNLASMPEGSFGQVYYQMCCQDDTLPGYLLGGLIYRDGFFDALDVDDDTRWYLERVSFDHDASHIISDYSTDLAAESLNIMFNLGHRRNVPRSRRFLNPFGFGTVITPTRLARAEWKRELTRAFDRGAAAGDHFPLPCIPYEELLPLPLEEARGYLGVPPLPEDWDTSDWCTKDPYADVSPEEKASQAEIVALVDGAVRAGLNWREYMRADADSRNRFVDMLRAGKAPQEARLMLH
jgi:ubiquinone biosynthesis protein Coq4